MGHRCLQVRLGLEVTAANHKVTRVLERREIKMYPCSAATAPRHGPAQLIADAPLKPLLLRPVCCPSPHPAPGKPPGCWWPAADPP